MNYKCKKHEENTQKHIVIKFLKTNDKEKILKQQEEHIILLGTIIMLIADLL